MVGWLDVGVRGRSKGKKCYRSVWSTGGMTMNPTRLSTQSALRSCTGASNARPAAMYVERRMRCEAGEYEGPVTPERRVLRQKVVGRTANAH